MTCRGALFHPSQTPDVAGQPDRASEGGRSLSGPATSGRTPSSLDLLLAEIGRVHLYGWEGNPRDESRDGEPRHAEGACRKCSILRGDDALRVRIWKAAPARTAPRPLDELNEQGEAPVAVGHEFWQDPNDSENPACRVCDKAYLHVMHHQISEHDSQWSRKIRVKKAVCGGYVQHTDTGTSCSHGVVSTPIYEGR